MKSPNSMHTPQQLHQAYQDSTGYELAINAYTERLWYEAARWGVTPDDVKLVIKARIKRNLTQQFKSSLLINRLIGDEADLAQFTNELAAIRAEMRKPVYDAGKVTVLKATHRPTEPPPADAKHVSEIFQQMRKEL